MEVAELGKKVSTLFCGRSEVAEVATAVQDSRDFNTVSTRPKKDHVHTDCRTASSRHAESLPHGRPQRFLRLKEARCSASPSLSVGNRRSAINRAANGANSAGMSMDMGVEVNRCMYFCVKAQPTA
jgi:hypothetical protein